MSRPARLEAGLRRHRAQQRREAIARVKAFRAWCRRGSPLREIPQVPTDADYAVARAAGEAD